LHVRDWQYLYNYSILSKDDHSVKQPHHAPTLIPSIIDDGADLTYRALYFKQDSPTPLLAVPATIQEMARTIAAIIIKVQNPV